MLPLACSLRHDVMMADRTEFDAFTLSGSYGFATKGLPASKTLEEVGKWATVPKASQWELINI